MKKYIAILIAVLLLVSIAGCAASNPDAGAQQPEKLTKERSKEIALTHANLKESQVTGLRSEYDVDDGIPQYEVEFRQGDYEFEYVIHAETGEVLSWDKEYDPVKTTNPSTAPTEPTPEPDKPTAERLTEEEAVSVALEHAGFTREQVTRLQVEYEVDDGVPEYSVEFYADGWEYDYEIHAESGKILEWDKDRD